MSATRLCSSSTRDRTDRFAYYHSYHKNLQLSRPWPLNFSFHTLAPPAAKECGKLSDDFLYFELPWSISSQVFTVAGRDAKISKATLRKAFERNVGHFKGRDWNTGNGIPESGIDHLFDSWTDCETQFNFRLPYVLDIKGRIWMWIGKK